MVAPVVDSEADLACGDRAAAHLLRLRAEMKVPGHLQ